MPLNDTDLAAIESEAAALEAEPRRRPGKFSTFQVSPLLRDLVKHLAAIDRRSQHQELLYLVEQEYQRRGIPLPPVE